MKKRSILSVVVIAWALLSAAPAFAQEKVTLAAPQQAPAITEYTIRYFAIDVEHQRILVEMRANNGDIKTIIYKNTPAVLNADGQIVTPADNIASTLITQLNVANNAVKSMRCRVLERLVVDKQLAGTAACGGAPAPEEAPLLRSAEAPATTSVVFTDGLMYLATARIR